MSGEFCALASFLPWIIILAPLLWVYLVEMIVGHRDRQHNGSLILLPYLGHTIFSSDTLPDMFT